MCDVILTIEHKTPELQEAIHHAFLSAIPTLVEVAMKEQIPDKKERDEFAAKLETEGRNPDYHWYTEMYALLRAPSDIKVLCFREEANVA